jgi:hypothetical protein
MQSALLSHDPCGARQRPEGSLSAMQSSVRSFVHSVPSSVPQQHGATEMPSATGRVGRNIDTLRTQVETRLVAAFTEAAPQYQVKAASLAPVIGASASTLEGYRQRFPQAAVNLVLLGQRLPMFGLEMMDIMGIDIDAQRDSYAQFLELQRRIRGQ